MGTGDSSTPQSVPGRPLRSGIGWALLGLVLTVAGVAGYFAMLRQPFLRSSGLLLWAGVAVGLACCWFGWRRSRWPARLLVVLHLGLVALLTFTFLVVFRLPAAPELAKLDQAPEVGWLVPTGQRESLQDRLKQGPVLLTFYRGEW